MKSLWKVSVSTTPEAEDAVSESLASIFNTFASAYFDVESRRNTVSVFVQSKPSDGDRESLRQRLRQVRKAGLAVGAGRVVIAKVRREDWANSWKRHFHPIEVGQALLVKASWHRRAPRRGQALVILDPGLSFGTGQHPTTAFCLDEIVRCRKSGRQSFLDIGTGSGILAIAAAKLGYAPVHAFDFDPEAVRIARANAHANGVKIRIVRGDAAKLPLRPKRTFDVVCANLISTLLIAERKRIAAQVSRDGVLVLAGILRSEFPEVRRAFTALGLKPAGAAGKNEWRSGSFQLI